MSYIYCVCTCIATWSETTLTCDPLQGLCPGDNEQRVCTCVITSATNTSALRLYTNQSGVFPPPAGVSFFPHDSVKTKRTDMGFTAILTNKTVGSLTVNLIFTPDAVSTTGLKITCENPSFSAVSNKTMAVMFTYAGTHTFVLLWCWIISITVWCMITCKCTISQYLLGGWKTWPTWLTKLQEQRLVYLIIFFGDHGNTVKIITVGHREPLTDHMPTMSAQFVWSQMTAYTCLLQYCQLSLCGCNTVWISWTLSGVYIMV